MQASKVGTEPIAPALHSGQPVQMGLHQDKNQDTIQVPASSSPLAQASIHEVDPKTKKLSLEERLSGLSEYRMLESEIESAVEMTGRGGRADVVRANFKRSEGACGEEVAVKKIRYTQTTKDEKLSKEFVHEVKLLAKLSHENIVRLVGFVEDLKRNEAWIVLSWAPNGNVREFLASGNWEIPERVSLMQDMFAGLQYLHTRQPPICHGDLKSLNILVSSSCRAVITDFGSARVLRDDDYRPAYREKMQNAGEVAAADEGDGCPEVTVVASANQLTLTGPVWTLRWAAPELMMDEARLGLASDIWSAGWVCWEMMTNRIPFGDVRRDCAVIFKVIHGEVPLVREDTEMAQVMRLCSLMTDCWKYKPEDRPDVNQCCDEVGWMPSIPPWRGTSSGSKELSHDLLLKMGRMHYEQSRPEKAAALLQKIVANAESAVPQEVLAEALKSLGDVHHVQCNFGDAKEWYTRAQEIYIRIGNDQGRASTLEGLGRVYCAQSKCAEAEELYTRAQEICAHTGDDQGRANTMLGLGHVYSLQRKYADAEESYTRAQEIYARIGAEGGRANTILGLGLVYDSQCKYAEAEESYTRAQEIYARIGDDQGLANTLDGLGRVHNAQDKYDEAEESYTQTQEICARIGNDLGRANTLDGLGDVYRSQCKYAEAEESYTRAQEIYARIGDDQGRANPILGLGHVYLSQRKYADAEESFTRAQEIYARFGRDQSQANTILGLGDVYRSQRKYAEAEESYTRAQEIYARLGRDQGRANTILRLGHVYRSQRKYAEAEESYTRAQEIYARIGDDLGRANTILGLGRVYRSQCKYAEAEDSYTRAHEIYARLGRDLGRANTLDGLGQVYYAQDKYDEAEESCTRAQEIYARIGNDRGRAKTILDLGDVYRSQCKYAEAEESYRRAQEIFARIGEDLGRANTLRGFGHLYSMQGRRMDASQVYTEARDLYFQIGRTVDAYDAACWLYTVRDGWTGRAWSSCRESFSHALSKLNVFRSVRFSHSRTQPTGNEQAGHLP